MKGSPRPWSLNCEHSEDSIPGTEATTDGWMTHHSEGSAWSWEKGRPSPLLFSISSQCWNPYISLPFTRKTSFLPCEKEKTIFGGEAVSHSSIVFSPKWFRFVLESHVRAHDMVCITPPQWFLENSTFKSLSHHPAPGCLFIVVVNSSWWGGGEVCPCLSLLHCALKMV